jgi:putative acyl-CoA dehydrogenase
MECLGGNGYVEEAPLARLYREAPLNGIWEGSANVICLDALRAVTKSSAAFAALADEIAAARDPRLARRLDWAAKMLADPAMAEPAARSIAETLALCMQAALMKRHSDPGAAEAFCVSRLDSPASSLAFGTLPAGTDTRAIVARASLQA